MTGFPVISD